MDYFIFLILIFIYLEPTESHNEWEEKDDFFPHNIFVNGKIFRKFSSICRYMDQSITEFRFTKSTTTATRCQSWWKVQRVAMFYFPIFSRRANWHGISWPETFHASLVHSLADKDLTFFGSCPHMKPPMTRRRVRIELVCLCFVLIVLFVGVFGICFERRRKTN